MVVDGICPNCVERQLMYTDNRRATTSSLQMTLLCKNTLLNKHRPLENAVDRRLCSELFFKKANKQTRWSENS